MRPGRPTLRIAPVTVARRAAPLGEPPQGEALILLILLAGVA